MEFVPCLQPWQAEQCPTWRRKDFFKFSDLPLFNLAVAYLAMRHFGVKDFIQNKHDWFDQPCRHQGHPDNLLLRYWGTTCQEGVHAFG